ncbi:hypothetical protein TTHERM_00219430 (macronuclear) [Tetrahymena thermophila SB210]|uniref:Uncharacterized protein n=1 Tax=Tetrahymena thermophila (strain SB210) TaxID=312017 RepID=I7LVZ0_TETTS|nr:hypothetical protein TTHERM_00219430 [Tetrahymena thermophila SB210]EAS00370.1 hypothetical protein TTHERM_00219430 [Tetrahymena thermophila SB210]|eukprot:XP_001020615.1 hypothetical protein TTHERM_00219430 [Tetrahymena thermophila SB210]
MNIQQIEIKTVLGKDEQIFSQLRSDLQIILKAEKNLIQAYKTFSTNMRQKIYTKEYIEAMKQIFQDTAIQYEGITKKRQDLADLIDTKMLPSLNSYISEVKEIKNTLVEYEKKVIQADNKLQEKIHAESTKQETKIEKAVEAYREANLNVKIFSKKMQKQLDKYMHNKNQELKCLILHLANKQMLIDAESLKSLSILTQNVNNHKEKEETENFLETVVGRTNNLEN